MATNPRYANGHRRRQLRTHILATQDTCALCDQPVDKTLPHLHPWSAVIDEDIPVSRGGDPLKRGNTNLMHRWCNSWKSTRTLAEARAAWAKRGQARAVTTSREW